MPSYHIKSASLRSFPNAISIKKMVSFVENRSDVLSWLGFLAFSIFMETMGDKQTNSESVRIKLHFVPIRFVIKKFNANIMGEKLVLIFGVKFQR